MNGDDVGARGSAVRGMETQQGVASVSGLGDGFRKAEKRQARLRLALDGPSGSGKTYTALITATAIAGKLGGRVAVIDTERGSASLYADRFDFDVPEITAPYDPAKYVRAIRLAENAGYPVIVIDSISHAWEGEGGVQEIVDRNKKGGNQWSGWAAGTPAYRSLIEAMLSSTTHVICTMRTKTEWAETTDGKGKKGYERVGTAPVMRAGVEYEFTIVGDIDLEHTMRIGKTRFAGIADKQYRHPDESFGLEVLAWLEDGEEAALPEWQVRADGLRARFGPDEFLAAITGPDGVIAPIDRLTDAQWERLESKLAGEAGGA